VAKLRPLTASANAPDQRREDAIAYIAYLDSPKKSERGKEDGALGYCMGGPLVAKTAALLPDR
jgi:carboxymethylenebutenolidase